MEDKEATPSSSPSSSSSPSICCMCGDHGLHQELFRCKLCRFRSQHKYCSVLYPKVENYGACNWCLREEGGKSLAQDNNSKSISPSSFLTKGGTGVNVQRGPFSLQVNKPIKKQRLSERPVSDVNGRMRSEEISPRLGRPRQAFRGRVRRYKLLEEVSS